jgi:GGDEF domain-containing protein
LILASTQAALQLPDLAERLRGLVESSRLQWWGEAITFTVSIGGTAVGTHDSVADAVRRAEDNALQAAREGGNRVILAES